jgi:hypothetical protein
VAKPSFSSSKAKCSKLQNQSPPPELAGVPPSGWSWTQTVESASDGIYEFVIGNVSTFGPGGSTGVGSNEV